MVIVAVRAVSDAPAEEGRIAQHGVDARLLEPRNLLFECLLPRGEESVEDLVSCLAVNVVGLWLDDACVDVPLAVLCVARERAGLGSRVGDIARGGGEGCRGEDRGEGDLWGVGDDRDGVSCAE